MKPLPKKEQYGTAVNISSNTLFHFTSKENFLGILRDNFLPRYCAEFSAFDLSRPELKNWRELEVPPPPTVAVPIVSFSDLPLFLIKNHASCYGNYGIGLTKQWGIRNSVSPVFYVVEGSTVFRSMVEIWKRSMDGKVLSNETWATLINTKVVEGPSWRKNELSRPTRFYDEREWRYIPAADWNSVPGILTAEHYRNDRTIREANNFLKDFPLRFRPADIRYLIVEKDSEVLELQDAIMRIKGNTLFAENELRSLATRMVAANVMFED